MNLLNLFTSRYRLSLLGAGLAVLVLAGTPSYAAPGAHGPNGEHLDAPAQAGVNSGPVPSFEARSEAFELVGRLQGGELSILINRFATNEPVLNATVEVETGNLKAPAKFHADMGTTRSTMPTCSRPWRRPVTIPWWSPYWRAMTPTFWTAPSRSRAPRLMTMATPTMATVPMGSPERPG